MTDPRPTPNMRIFGDRLDAPEFFVPISTPRHLAVFRRLDEGPTPEERKRWARELARRETKRRQALADSVARYAELLEAHRDSPVVSALLVAHGPHSVEIDSKPHAECHGCPTYWDYDPFGESSEVYHEWPCPTWTAIAERTEGQT